MPNAKPPRPAARPVDPLGLLLRDAVFDHQQQADVVAHDHVLVLQVAVQAKALVARCCRMIAMPRLVPSRPPYFLGNA